MSLSQLYQKYHQDVEFITVYIREAHPVDGWWFGTGVIGFFVKLYRSNASTELYDPKTIEERRAAAGQCEEALKYGIRTYVDEIDDRVNKAYAAWPTRLYLVGKDGKVEYAAGLGPWDFKPGKLEQAIENYLKAN